MDDRRWERTFRLLGEHVSRRGLGGLAAGSLAVLGLSGIAGAKKKKKKKKKKKPAGCTPQSQEVTCAGTCGSVANNCGQQVNCGACTGYVLDKKIGGFGSGTGQFADPEGIAIDSDDTIYVADSSNDRIQKLSNDGDYLDHWGGSALGLDGPEAVAVDSVGNIYIADTSNYRVVKLDSDGAFVTEWNTAADEEDELLAPRGIAVDPSDAVWVSDWGNQRVVKFTGAGVFLEQIGGPGLPDLWFPQGLASNGTVYVADGGNDRIQRFPGGPFGEEGDEEGKFSAPRGVALDADGNLYVVDAGNSRVQKFDSSGAHLLSIVESQAADGTFGYLAGVAVDSAGNVFVLDETRDCIHKFRPAGAARVSRESEVGSRELVAESRHEGRRRRSKHVRRGARRG